MKHSTSHTILPSGKSVEDCLQCLEDTEKRTLAIKESKKQLLDDFHDDFCVYCGVGGDLVCCETCPITCHYGCAGLESAPEGAWYCPGCLCRLCHKTMYVSVKETLRVYRGDACFVGETSSLSSYRDILDSSIRKRLVLGNQHKINDPLKNENCKPSCERDALIMEAFHTTIRKPLHKKQKTSCSKQDLSNRFDEVRSVCGARSHSCCLSQLAQPIGDGVPWYNEFEAKVLTGITHICCQGALKIGAYSCGSDVSFQIIHAAAASGQQLQGLAPFYSEGQKQSLRKILSGCLAVLNDSYNDIWDSRTGMNLIPMMLQGRSASPHIDFSGMYVAPLFINSTIASVACFRLLGSGVAEIPLFATRQEIRGCKAGRILLNKIEAVLHEFGVGKLVMHATYCPLYPYLPAFHPQGEALPSPSQDKFGFKIASRKTTDIVISHGGVRIPGVPWVEKNIEVVDWPSRMKTLKETRLGLNPGVLDIDSRLRCGTLSLANMAVKHEETEPFHVAPNEDIKPLKPKEEDAAMVPGTLDGSGIVSLTNKILETLAKKGDEIQEKIGNIDTSDTNNHVDV